MKIATKIIMAITAVLCMALALPVTAIELIINVIIDVINGVRNGRIVFDRTAGMWTTMRDYAERVYNGEI